MPPRKLTKRQQIRIAKFQQQKRERAETLTEQNAENNATATKQEQTGTIISHYGKTLEIVGLDGQHYRCRPRQNLPALVTGDNVIWYPDGNATGIITAHVPRNNLLSRPDSRGKLKPVAANIDAILLVIAVIPEPMEILIDRYLVAAELMQLSPVIVCNKIDLIQSKHIDALNQLLTIYRDIGYSVLMASSHSQQGLNDLQIFLQDKVSVFVGQSGVGKSSLISAVLPEIDIPVGNISNSTGKGRHTTTTARLYNLTTGGSLIDSPGIREFGLWHLTATDVTKGFVEFRPYLSQCKFRDCQHQPEQLGCAVYQAVIDGKIAASRYKSFQRIVQRV